MGAIKKKTSHGRLDADETVQFLRDLEHVKGQEFEVKYAPLKGLRTVPVNTEADPADETFTVRTWDGTASMKLISSYATDFPRADVFAQESSVPFKSYGNGYGYSVQDIRRAAKSGRPLSTKKRNMAKKGADFKLDKIIQSGDVAAGFKGLLNQTGTLTYTIPADGTGSSKTFASKTPDQVVRDLHGMCNAMVLTTNEVEVPDTMLMPLSLYQYVTSTRMGAGDGTLTIMKTFLSQRDDIKTVMPWVPLETAGAGPSKRIVVYRRAPDVLELLLPVPFEEFAPEAKGMEWEIACHMRTGGIVVYLPSAILFADGG